MTCPGDCGMCPAACPDFVCDIGEDCMTCPIDCGTCPVDDCADPDCEYVWCGTAFEDFCPDTWNGTGDGCDCGCQFVDPDCPP
jgi:hypothetical protein